MAFTKRKPHPAILKKVKKAGYSGDRAIRKAIKIDKVRRGG